MSSGIYQIRNIINSKRYVGSTKNFEKRWKEHINLLSKGKHSSVALQRAWDKYGSENFIFEIIEECEYIKELIIEREDYWIKELKSKTNDNGYNIGDASFGDTFSHHPNKEQREKNISEGGKTRWANMTKDKKELLRNKAKGVNNGMYGKTHSKESIEKMRKTKEERKHTYKKDYQKFSRWSEEAKERNKGNWTGNKNPFFGRAHSEESKRKMSESRKGIPSSLKGKSSNLSKESREAIGQGAQKRLGGNNGRARPLMIYGVKYACIQEALKALGKSSNYLFARLNDENNLDFMFITKDNI